MTEDLQCKETILSISASYCIKICHFMHIKRMNTIYVGHIRTSDVFFLIYTPGFL